VGAEPAHILLALAGALGLWVVGLCVYVVGATQRGTLADRSQLSAAEPWTSRALRTLDLQLRRTGAGRRLTLWLMSSGLSLGPLMFLGLCVVAFLTGWAITSLLIPGGLAVFVGLVCMGGCISWVNYQRTQRRYAFVAQLPEVARLLSNAAQAGLSLAGAVERAARELDAPACDELDLVVQELRLGGSLDESLRRLQDRLPSREVAVLMSTLIIQQRAGGDTVRALQDMAETLDARKDTLREVRTLMAGAVFTSYIVAAMGVGTILIMNVMSPGVLDKLLGSLIGIAALTVAGILYAVGFMLIRTTTKIEL